MTEVVDLTVEHEVINIESWVLEVVMTKTVKVEEGTENLAVKREEEDEAEVGVRRGSEDVGLLRSLLPFLSR